MNEILEIETEQKFEWAINKSKFIAFSFIIRTQQDVENALQKLSKEYADATHICYAYKFGGTEKCSDNGEPQGTAGKPILDCIKKKSINNVLVAVVRYFGGIKLGANGLVRAYSASASSVLDSSGTKTKVKCREISFNFEPSMQKQIGALKMSDTIKKFDIDYQNYKVKITVPVEKIQDIEQTINNIFQRQAEIVIANNADFY